MEVAGDHLSHLEGKGAGSEGGGGLSPLFHLCYLIVPKHTQCFETTWAFTTFTSSSFGICWQNSPKKRRQEVVNGD